MKMKDIISSILITALLIQIVGCYSYRDLTLGDLKKLNGKESIKLVTKDSTEYILQNPPESFNSNQWSMDENNIYIYSNAGKFGKNFHVIPIDSLKLPLNSIESISTENFDSGKTVLAVIGVVAILSLAFLIVLGIALNNATKDCSEGVVAYR
jgi:hypothetical protein